MVRYMLLSPVVIHAWQSNPDFSLHNCAVSCGICKVKCKDEVADCPQWAAQGACAENKHYMAKACPLSCDVCHAHHGQEPHSTCLNQEEDAACKRWAAEGECQSNADFMMRRCAGACGLCKNVCQDHDVSCPAWSKAGECKENQAFMLKTCPASCGVCSKLKSSILAKERRSKDEM